MITRARAPPRRALIGMFASLVLLPMAAQVALAAAAPLAPPAEGTGSMVAAASRTKPP